MAKKSCFWCLVPKAILIQIIWSFDDGSHTDHLVCIPCAEKMSESMNDE